MRTPRSVKAAQSCTKPSGRPHTALNNQFAVKTSLREQFADKRCHYSNDSHSSAAWWLKKSVIVSEPFMPGCRHCEVNA